MTTKPKRSRRDEVWTKRCPKCDGCFIPDENDICDYCVLKEVGLEFKGTSSGCGCCGCGPTVYEKDDVVAALRQARKR
jgi:hypothetical protein